MNKRRLAMLLGVACVAVLGSATAVVRATQTAGQINSCTVSYIAYANDEVIIKCAEVGPEFMAWGPSWTACQSRQSMDTLKMFNTIANAALLSGKKLGMNYVNDTTCPTATSVGYIKLF
jgi:hypothetical protein